MVPRLVPSLVAGVDQRIQQADAQEQSRWSDLVEAGDDLATKIHQTALVRRIASTRRDAISLQRMEQITAATVTEKLCPAKKAFVQSVGGARFQERTRKHCYDEAPTAQGLSGAQVTLTNECLVAFASACP
jgi:hypothetical protein